MRIAFYAPLKSPNHRVISGDRQIARLLLRALRRKGHRVRVVSSFRSFDATGDRRRQAALKRRGTAIADRLARGRLAQWRPDLWLTYHLYYKAPDWLGPRACRALGIPYVLAEVSSAPKRSNGPWATGQAAVVAAVKSADRILFLNGIDRECVAPLMNRHATALDLAPFLDAERFARTAPGPPRGNGRRRELSLLTVAMMRHGDKLESYRLLAAALARLRHRAWRLLVVGDGPARHEVEALFAELSDRVIWLGALSDAALRMIHGETDIFVWPAVNEAIGMAVLEAQAAGLPAVVGRAGAIPDIVAHRRTGLVVRGRSAASFARALQTLLDDGPARRAMGRAARRKVRRDHDLAAAAACLDRALRATVETFRR